MKNIWKETRQMVQLNASFDISFETKSLKVNGKYIIKDGKYDGSLGMEKHDKETLIGILECMYHDYKYSRPSKKDANRRKNYFAALSLEDLSEDDISYGLSRYYARCVLELYILIQSLLGAFSFVTEFFWTDLKKEELRERELQDTLLIIMKEWVN